MIADIARNACMLTAPNGNVFTFFNSVIENKENVSYFPSSGDKALYRMVYGEAEKRSQFRALHYARFSPNGAIGMIPRPVPFHDTNAANKSSSSSGGVSSQESSGITVTPLYETITPCIGRLPGRPGFQVMFWTNLKDRSNTLEKNAVDAYVYDASKILKFENDKLEEIDFDSYSIRLLCSAAISWYRLRASGGVSNDSAAIYTPVIKAVYVLMVQEGSIAIDFSGGGMGGGMRRHNHADNNNAGFAYAVFAPGTSLQPINWK